MMFKCPNCGKKIEVIGENIVVRCNCGYKMEMVKKTNILKGELELKGGSKKDE